MMRAHLISLSLLLGLTVSLVWGQAPTHFSLSGVIVTGPIAITSVGIGYYASPPLFCYPTNASNTVWLFPDGSMITEATTNVFATDTFIFHRSSTTNIVYLRPGSINSVRSPGGDYCCGSATNVNERLCINLVVDCEMPPFISNGCLGMPTSTLLGGTVTYTCNSGYQISPDITMATASCLATGNWENVTCLAETIGTPPHALSLCDTSVAILSAVVVILGLALISLAVIIAYLVLKQRRMGGVNLKTPDIPLTDKAQSSPTQTFDTLDVSYEEVDMPRPLKGSYEYNQCEAYASTPVGGVVNVVKTH